MLHLSTDWPIDLHPTNDVIDSSKLKEYLTCPRKYFYRYVLGWEKTGKNIDLIFGEAWHRAMAQLLTMVKNDLPTLKLNAEELVEIAMKEFTDYYSEFYPIEAVWIDHAPKDPNTARMALLDYIKQGLHKTHTLVTGSTGEDLVEVAGSMALFGINIHFRLDAIVENKEGTFVLEHKTASQLTRSWASQWGTSLQTGLYHFALTCLSKDAKGLIVNGSFWRKKGIEFVRVPVIVSDKMAAVGLSVIEDTVYRLTHDYERLSECKPEHSILDCFMLNPSQCSIYYGCPFIDLCTCWHNPLEKVNVIPEGFSVRWWDPREASKQRGSLFLDFDLGESAS